MLCGRGAQKVSRWEIPAKWERFDNPAHVYCVNPEHVYWVYLLLIKTPWFPTDRSSATKLRCKMVAISWPLSLWILMYLKFTTLINILQPPIFMNMYTYKHPYWLAARITLANLGSSGNAAMSWPNCVSWKNITMKWLIPKIWKIQGIATIYTILQVLPIKYTTTYRPDTSLKSLTRIVRDWTQDLLHHKREHYQCATLPQVVKGC